MIREDLLGEREVLDWDTLSPKDHNQFFLLQNSILAIVIPLYLLDGWCTIHMLAEQVYVSQYILWANSSRMISL